MQCESSPIPSGEGQVPLAFLERTSLHTEDGMLSPAHYELGDTLGQGMCGPVRRAVHRHATSLSASMVCGFSENAVG